ncbi:Cysteine desulfurase IscS [Commensalibacter sp. Nvir]|uniref:cysteine desulfurase family protein n=1 Tax=Commensalibacter sp. Nvir TaxID=3069817 RepID=UPI002D2A28C8|nr:Cysteine desulfurase IscS [Commensalibacter sp. Nvir]
MDKLIYLDYQATTPCDERVFKSMLPYYTTCYGNAHSEHIMGKTALQAVEQARKNVADLIDADSKEIIFTSGATESNNLAIQGAVAYLLSQGNQAKQVITLATEHKSVLETVQSVVKLGLNPIVLPVNSEGFVNLNRLENALKQPTLLVSIMMANNETGVIQSVKEIASLSHRYGAIYHCDIAQSVGKLAYHLSMKALDIDMASISGHKIYGPKGIGALFLRRKPRMRLLPLFYGGGQERGLRSGTLAVPLIVGLGEACKILIEEGIEEIQRLADFKRMLLQNLYKNIPHLNINGSQEHCLPGCVNLRLPQLKASELFKRVCNLCLSSSSACSESSLAPSYVLKAMALSDEEAFRSIRLSFGRMTTLKEVQQTIHSLSQAWLDAMTVL